jgi:CHAT domain-containing protein/tetratricopeptide (TPR) repeat protein
MESGLALEISQGLYRAHAYRRALRLVNRIAVPRSSEANTLQRTLTAVLDVLRETIPQSKVAEWGTDPISAQLIDLMGVLPESNQEDEFSLAEQKISTASPRAGSSDAAIVTAENPDNRPRQYRGPFLLAAYDNFSKHSRKALLYETEQPEFVTLSLSASEQRMGMELLSGYGPGAMELREGTPQAEFTSRLVAHLPPAVTLGQQEGSHPCVTADHLDVLLVRSIKVLIATDHEQECLFFLTQANLTTFKVVGLSLTGSYHFDVIDLLKQGSPQIVGRMRVGSGQYLSAVVIDPVEPRVLFSPDAFNHGSLTLVQLRTDAPDAILAVEKSEFGRTSCNQCPARALVRLYVFDTTTRMYELVATTTTYGEAQTVPTDASGLGAANYALLPDELGTPIQQAHNLSTLIRNSPMAMRSPKLLSDADELFGQLHTLLSESGQFSLDEEIQAELVAAVGDDQVAPEWQDLRRMAQLHRMNSLLSAGNYEQGLALAAEAWMRQELADDPDRASYYNTLAMLYQSVGQFHFAYDSYLKALDIAKKRNQDTTWIEGNLASYFRLIGDPGSSYFHALYALDSGIKQEKDLSVDMVNLAAASFEMSREEEALEWVGRALRISRGSGEGGIGMFAFRIASAIALKHHKTSLALALLDEALGLVNSPGWAVDGGGFLLSYAKALQEQHDFAHATRMLSSSAALSKGVSTRTYVSALYELSRLSYAQNSASRALSLAKEAFNGINSGRRQIGLEAQKFSFLSDKESIASWLFRLLIETGAHPVHILRAVESWKLRTFLEVYEESKGSLDQVDPESMPSSLVECLDDGDSVLEFVVTEDASFGIIVSKSEGVKRFALGTSTDSIRASVSKVRREFDLTNSKALAAIRKEVPSAELTDGLRELYEGLVENAPIPPGTKRLIIASDKALFGIPWPALRLDSTESLIDRFEVVVVPSATLALWAARRGAALRREAGSHKTALIVCALAGGTDVSVDMRGFVQRLTFAPLRKGWDECQGVARLMDGMSVKMIVDPGTSSEGAAARGLSSATPETFLAEAPEATVIHVVAHGLFDIGEPMHSKLFLGAGMHGRILDAEGISKLNLEKTELVTLASCQTALSGPAPGDEPLGFLRAIFAAGVPSVILAEWEIDDEATSRLLLNYYLGARTKRRSRALQQAQLATRRTHRHPYFWAGVSLYGYGN